MANKIESQVIGELVEEHYPGFGFWKSKEVPIPFFDGKLLPVIFTFEAEADKSFISEADETLINFFGLDQSYRQSVSHLVFKYCKEYIQAVGFCEADKPLWELQEQDGIWQYVYPNEVYLVRRGPKREDIYVEVDCECEWDPEHGLQLVFRRGKKLIGVSEQGEHLTEADTYEKPDEEDEFLSAF